MKISGIIAVIVLLGALFAAGAADAASTTTTLTSSVGTVACGNNVTFTATITPSVPNGEIVTFLDSGAPIGTAATSGSVSKFATTMLAAGSHSITASYPGDSSDTASTSSALTVTVSTRATTTTLSSALNPAGIYDDIPLTATLSPRVPNGEIVTFYDGSTSVGTGTISAGQATLWLGGLAAGSHSLTASYPGDGSYLSSKSSALTQVVGKETVDITMMSSGSPSAVGQPVTFSATLGGSGSSSSGVAGTISNNTVPVSPTWQEPTEQTMTFYDGSTTIGTVTMSGMGATFTTSKLSAGSHSITASYPGDSYYAKCTSTPVVQVVSAALKATTTSLSSSVPTSVYGQAVTLTAKVSPTVPNGETITFWQWGYSIGTATTSGGMATLTTASLSSETNAITASYPGDTAYAASSSSVLTQNVLLQSSLTVASSGSPSAVGQTLTFTATIGAMFGGQVGASGETITFYDGATSIGTGQISWINVNGAPSAPGSMPIVGTAAMTTSALAVGSHKITAIFAGDSNFAASTSSAIIQVVSASIQKTALTLTSSGSTLIFGQTSTFTAKVNPIVPNGETITFYDGATSVGTGKTASGAATLTNSSLATGSHNITASYPGDTTYAAGTSAALAETVLDPTTIALTSSANPAIVGQAVTFTATFPSGASGGEIVTFLDGSKTLGTGLIIWNNTTNGPFAALTVSTLAAGSHSITASYSGDTYYAPVTSSALTQVMSATLKSTAIALSSSWPSTLVGQYVTFTAKVSPAVPNGEIITFYNGTMSLGTGKTLGGTATITTATLLYAGNSYITARYSGDATYAGSTSNVVTQNTLEQTTTTLTSSGSPSAVGQSVTITASISPSAWSGDSVTFYDGSALIGTALVSSYTTANSTANLTMSSLAAGSHSLTAIYAGNMYNGPSTSAVITQVVSSSLKATTMTLTSSGSSLVFGQVLTFTAKLSPAVPNGEVVTFLSDGVSIGTGTSSGGTATLTTSTLADGRYAITAAYPGDATYAACTSNVVSQNVLVATTTTVASSGSPSVAGQAVTFTASIQYTVPPPPPLSPMAGRFATVRPSDSSTLSSGASDTVTFYDGGVLIGQSAYSMGGSNGITATFTTSALAAGSHSITASYSGDSYYAPSTSSALTQVVSMAVAPAGSTYVLWGGSNAASLWNITPAGSMKSATYGPISGWSPVALSSDASGNAYLLWTTSSGQASVWKVGSTLALATSQALVSSAGWTAKSIAVGPDGNVHVLWNHASDNAASLYDIALGSSYTSAAYGPYTGWQALQVVVDSANNTRVLWSDTSASLASLWNITSAGVQTSQTFGPFTGWQAQYLAVGPDNLARIVWTCTSTKVASVFTISSGGSYIAQAFGPYSGWTPADLAINNDGDSELMWNSTSNALSLLDIGAMGTSTSSAYGPYSGWKALGIAPGP